MGRTLFAIAVTCCSLSLPAVANDTCDAADALAGEGAFAIDLGSSTDGPAVQGCILFGQTQISNDDWFCWTAGGTDLVIVRTCDSPSSLDTKMVVYEGCFCPASDVDRVACSDDDCGIQSELAFIADAGVSYMIRVGTFPGTPGGAGTLRVIVCAGDVDYNGRVDIDDLGLVLANFNGVVDPGEDGDATGDGVVNIDDLGEVLANFNRQCV